jgi:hypothetical protein
MGDEAVSCSDHALCVTSGSHEALEEIESGSLDTSSDHRLGP